MLNQYKYEGKTKEEALEKALSELNVEEPEIYITEEYIEGKLFKGSKYILTVTLKKEIKEYISNYIENLGKSMNLTINSEINETDGIYNIVLVSDNNPILIGREGKTLNSIQTLLRQSLKTQTGYNIKVNVDVSNYKNNKMKNLERKVKQIAKEVQSTQVDVSLDPMNSYERRMIHSALSEWNNISTESIGEGKERHIVIKYVENEKH